MLQVDPAELGPDTTFEQLSADSLVLVGVADLVEAAMAQRGAVVLIDDTALAGMRTLADVAAYVSAGGVG